ncbi:MAG TPA: ADP-forming succinate--CoA ligase subunit beta [Phycisphaerales bacterium]|nr:ADP-forming succinate--CoA ligase subunit beta [Phycisphaerales bacterium]
MKIHEFQARDLLASYGIPVPAGRMIEKIDDARIIYKQVTQEAGLSPENGLAVVKAQVHAGGRGKAGFVKLVRSPQEAEDAARFMLSNKMVSVQTGPEGLEVKKLLIAAGVEIAHEYYLAITTDRETRRNTLIASAEGGVEIEKVAAENPDAILKQPIHPLMGLQPHEARRIAFELGMKGKQVGQAVKIMLALARLFVDKDCSLAEINPLIVTPANESAPDGNVLAIDAKFNFDDNGLSRHKDIQALFDPAEENPQELKAHRFGLSYIKLDGNIGCLVNGAGLAMATMDTIKHHGGEPANFLDVGGSATEEAVTEAFSIILSDQNVNGVLVNIFGGIMDCEVIAKGVVNAARNYKNTDGSTGFKVPLVVRLEGNNSQKGRALLESASDNLPTLQAATDLNDGAKKVVAAVG